MSYKHFECARQIQSVLRSKVGGLSRNALFDALQMQDKDERSFGEVLAELCHGREPQVAQKRTPNGGFLYVLMMDPPPLLPYRTLAVAPQQFTGLKIIPTKRATERRCACGQLLLYRGKGRAPEKCEACKDKALSLKYRKKRMAMPKCPTCGHVLKGAA